MQTIFGSISDSHRILDVALILRCWTYETALLCGQKDICEALPSTDYNEYFAPDYLLRVHSNKVRVANIAAVICAFYNVQIHIPN